jgi:hypothetical protein
MLGGVGAGRGMGVALVVSRVERKRGESRKVRGDFIVSCLCFLAGTGQRGRELGSEEEEGLIVDSRTRC